MIKYLIFLLSLLTLNTKLYADTSTVHIFVTDLAIQDIRIPELKKFMENHRGVIENASALVDAGYMSSLGYGEFLHWDGFLNRLATYIENNCNEKKQASFANKSLAMTPECEDLFAYYLGTLSHVVADIQWHWGFLYGASDNDFNGDYDAAHQWSEMSGGLNDVIIVENNLYNVPNKLYIPAPIIAKIILDARTAEIATAAEAAKTGTTAINLYLKDMDEVPYEQLKIDVGATGFAMSSVGAGLIIKAFGSNQLSLLDGARKSKPWTTNYKNYFNAQGGIKDEYIRVGAFWEVIWNKLQATNSFASIAILKKGYGKRVTFPGGEAAGADTALFASLTTNVAMSSTPVIPNHAASTYDRGAGTSPSMCMDGKSKIGSNSCQTPCTVNYTDVLGVCWEICPTDLTDIGMMCAASGWGFFTNSIWKNSYIKENPLPPTECSPYEEKQNGLCYRNCRAGFVGNGTTCIQN